MMIELNDKQIADFFHRSYTAVDGLWFMKIEEKFGFDTALEIDDNVWKVLPKIQSRMLKAMAGMENGIEALLECFTTKLTLEGCMFRVERLENDGGFKVIINRCPWHDVMVKSGREKLSPKVGKVICNSEYSGWASEFDNNIRFEQLCRICEGSETCIIQFSH
ncbi:DUF6125 family protein [Chloroflexota bacterium]